MAQKGQGKSILDELASGETVIASGNGGNSESETVAESERVDASAVASNSGAAGGYADDDFAAPERSAIDAGNDSGDDNDFGGADSGKRVDALGRDNTRKRGPAPGSARKTQTSTVTLIERLLIGIHTMGAAALKSPHWELSQSEANELAKAAANVQAQYDIALDAKTEAWLGLATVAGAMYAPRVMVSWHLAKENAKRVREARQANAPLPPGGGFNAPGAPPQPTQRQNGESAPARADGAVTPSQLFGSGFSGIPRPN